MKLINLPQVAEQCEFLRFQALALYFSAVLPFRCRDPEGRIYLGNPEFTPSPCFSLAEQSLAHSPGFSHLLICKMGIIVCMSQGFRGA